MNRKLAAFAAAFVSVFALTLFAHDHQEAAPAGLGQTESAMSDSAHHLQMGAHMHLSLLRAAKEGDQQRADQIVAAARGVAKKYADYRAAEKDGYRIFLPNIQQKMYHFTNWKFAMEAGFGFDASRPTSLLYEKQPDGSFKFIGVMYTAPARLPEGDLDQRVPLSVAQWHLHTNLCAPPPDQRQDVLSKNARFGLRGSIANAPECTAAGGTFHPVVFGWMVHVYPLEKSPEQIWSVERQHDHEHMDMH